jgi:hypothetical protein
MMFLPMNETHYGAICSFSFVPNLELSIPVNLIVPSGTVVPLHPLLGAAYREAHDSLAAYIYGMYRVLIVS